MLYHPLSTCFRRLKAWPELVAREEVLLIPNDRGAQRSPTFLPKPYRESMRGVLQPERVADRNDLGTDRFRPGGYVARAATLSSACATAGIPIVPSDFEMVSTENIRVRRRHVL